METACDLSLIVRDGRRVLPVRRADLCDEVRQLDLWWVPGEDDDRGDDGQDGLGVRKEYLRNNDDDDDRNIYPRNEHLLSVIDIKEDDQWDTGESPFIIYIIIMMMIFKKVTNDDIQVDLRHQDAAESQMRSNVRLKSESQSRVSDNHQSILLHQWFRDGSGYQDEWIFGKLPKRGGGSFSIKKFMLQILGTLNRAFWAWN